LLQPNDHHIDIINWLHN